MYYVKDREGTTHQIEICGWNKEQVTLLLDDCKISKRKIYYRQPRTWEDHMGITKSGYYAYVPITEHETHRVYLKLTD